MSFHDLYDPDDDVEDDLFDDNDDFRNDELDDYHGYQEYYPEDDEDINEELPW